jgi:hypothetical protein
MRVFYYPKPHLAPAKSIFIQGFENLLTKVFSFDEVFNEIIQLFKWIAKLQNPLYQDFYILQKNSVQ